MLKDKDTSSSINVEAADEARKVLVDEASSTLFTIAKDVKFQIEFNFGYRHEFINLVRLAESIK